MPLIVAIVLAASGVAPVAAASNVRIDVWFAGNPKPLMDTVLKEVVPAFERENPDIDLEVTFVPWGELSTKLATAFAGGVAPDLFMHGQAATAGFASSGQIEPLDGYIARMDDAADFGVTLDAGSYLGKRYMMPIFGSGWLLIYRADFFREAGLDPDKAPSTWEELREAARKVTIWRGNRLVREGLDLYTNGVNPPQIWANFLWQNGGDFFDKSFRKVTFNSPEGVEALELMAGFVLKDRTTDTSINMGHGSIPAIGTPEVAMIFGVPGDLANVKTYAPQVYPNLRVAPPLKRKTQAALYAFNGFFMASGSKHKEEAWRVLRFLSSPFAMEKINVALQSLPARQSLGKVPHIASDPNLQVYLQGMAVSRGNPNVPQWVKIRDTISRYIEQAMYGAMTPAKALEEAARESQRELQ
ncbi:MAG: ABC transporter substrate-binding protein [Limnochordaceae bacterium]|nr:ABC transporter substrate-binding protein [Limnochordaceae bacterium]